MPATPGKRAGDPLSSSTPLCQRMRSVPRSACSTLPTAGSRCRPPGDLPALANLLIDGEQCHRLSPGFSASTTCSIEAGIFSGQIARRRRGAWWPFRHGIGTELAPSLCSPVMVVLHALVARAVNVPLEADCVLQQLVMPPQQLRGCLPGQGPQEAVGRSYAVRLRGTKQGNHGRG